MLLFTLVMNQVTEFYQMLSNIGSTDFEMKAK